VIFSSRWDIPVCFLIFAVVLGVFAANEYSTSSDSRWTVHIAASLLKEGNFDLNEYLAEVRESRYYMVHCVTPDFRQLSPEQTECPPGSRYYGFYPLGTPVLAAPAVAVIEKAVYSLWTSVQDYIRRPGSSPQVVRLSLRSRSITPREFRGVSGSFEGS
jgi:hypothetical protein